MEEKKYFVGSKPHDYLAGAKLFDYYSEAVQALDNIEAVAGKGNFGIFKIVTSVSEATHLTEDYWEYR